MTDSDTKDGRDWEDWGYCIMAFILSIPITYEGEPMKRASKRQKICLINF
jgi:hypothetical protein